LLKERKANARRVGRGDFSTAEDQDSFIMRTFLEREVGNLLERKGFRKKADGEEV
jgi:hypothetical protein